ncbi:serine--tRNA ligase [Bacteroidales bacterium OttesenSCG-928-B11]|nr:serine--tRNA ligase [Bacteroidales bacterium OttesenSCG-928-C03]MDL2311822.1 serine--tRNA ligase [Bacteroidales bacterium OttesenSCG-928-B11]MDL2325529.1 serine--tRNA ligase [Bacteroidales bacterium OttesenSCG-928-A14]
MLQIQLLRQNPDYIIEKLKIKNFDATAILQQIQLLDGEIRAEKKSLDDNLMEQNSHSKKIGLLFKEGKREEAEILKTEIAVLKEREAEYKARLAEKEEAIETLLVQLPNLPHESVPKGKTAEDNEIILQEGEIETAQSQLIPHWDLVKKYDIVDFDLGSKITGAGFPVYKGKGAKLQRALINFFLDTAIENGYQEVQPPYMVNEASAYATGQLPDKEGQMYHITADNLYLIPTAEVPVTNIYRDIILKESDFPVKHCAYSACFRREAGSYGKDVRGLNRLHQFDKVEIVQVEHPDRSYDTLEEMREYVASLLRKLKLPFRVLRLCGGDISFTSALTYDLEVYSQAQQRWLEVSSVSNFESYQANRMKLRFKDGNEKPKLAHTLNGSALALPRIMAALIENNQTEEGIVIPEVLRRYTQFDIID